MKQTSTIETPAISDDAPKLAQADFESARFRVDNKDVGRAEWQIAVRARTTKQRINIMLDTPIVEHFKSSAGDRGYQTLINDTLRGSSNPAISKPTYAASFVRSWSFTTNDP